MRNFVIASAITAFFLIPYTTESADADTQPINYDTAYKFVENQIGYKGAF